MKIPKITLSLITLALLAQGNVNAETTNQPYDGSWKSLQQMPVPAWFDDGKIGIFIHWGPYSAIGYRKGGRGYAEHVPKLIYEDPNHYYPYVKKRWGATPPEFGYKDIIPDFKAENWDPDAWAKLFKDVGAHYVVMTAEHHDGWANWDSDLTPWNAADMGPKRDLVGDLGKALKKQGLKYAPSYHRERHQSFFTTKKYVVNAEPREHILEEIKRVPEAALLYGPFGTNKEFVDSYVARWKEIQEKYQPDMLWMDDFPIYTRDGNNVRKGIARPEVKYYDDQVRLMITEFMNDAASRGQPVYVNNKGGNRNWPDGVGCLEKDNLKLSVIGPKWQSCTTFGTSFGYLEGDTYKTIKGVIHEMIEVISRNGNFLINIGPKGDGTIPEPQVERLQAMGDWLRINGAAIYGSRYWKVSDQKEDHLSFTTNGKNLYAIALEKPTGSFTIDGTKGWSSRSVQNVKLLGSNSRVSWEMTTDGLQISPPSNWGKSEYAWTFEIATDRDDLHEPNVIVKNPAVALRGTQEVDLDGFDKSPATQSQNGVIALRAGDAQLRGGVKYAGPSDDFIGAWTSPSATVEWTMNVTKPGAYAVTATLGVGSPVSWTLQVGEAQSIQCELSSTGGIKKYKTVELGTVEFNSSGKQTIKLIPVSSNWKPVNLRSVKLTPVR